MEISSDGSLSGWGAVYQDKRAHGFWSEEEKEFSINFLELTAAFYALRCFADNKRNCQLSLRIDNTTAISYINRMGGVQFEQYDRLTKDIWQWCERRNIWIFASYISSKSNFEADTESRRAQENIDFALSNEGFDLIVSEFGRPDIDLFASRENAKCDLYVSYKRDPFSIAVDAFTIS